VLDAVGDAVVVAVGIRRVAAAHPRRDLPRIVGAAVEAIGYAVVIRVVRRGACVAIEWGALGRDARICQQLPAQRTRRVGGCDDGGRESVLRLRVDPEKYVFSSKESSVYASGREKLQLDGWRNDRTVERAVTNTTRFPK